MTTEYPEQRVVGAKVDLREEAQEHREHASLRHRRDQRRHRRRRPLVHVRRPQVERHHRQLVADADAHQPEPAQEKDTLIAVQGTAQRRDLRKLHRADLAVDERHAEQQERRRHRGQHQILYRRLNADRARAVVADERVERDAQHLQPEEERSEVYARRQHRRAERRQEKQHPVLLVVAGMLSQVSVRQDDQHQRRRQQHPDVEQSEVVHQEQRRRLTVVLARHNRQHRQRKRQPEERDRRRDDIVPADGDGQHHRHRRRGQNNEGQDVNPAASRHGVFSSPGQTTFGASAGACVVSADRVVATICVRFVIDCRAVARMLCG